MPIRCLYLGASLLDPVAGAACTVGSTNLPCHQRSDPCLAQHGQSTPDPRHTQCSTSLFFNRNLNTSAVCSCLYVCIV